MSKKDRVILTPALTSDFANGGDGLTYWKQILPESTIEYRKGKSTRHINFDSSYHHDLIDDFRNKRAIDQVHFQIAGSDNAHGRDMDPERQRALVVDMATYDDLPEDVKANASGPGLYAKMKFFNKRAAKAVRNNPGLGVSARVRENFPRADGTMVKRGIIHVLGTIDPRVAGMSGWQQSDLGYDSGDGNVLDLSNESYEENTAMAKNKSKTKTSEKTESHIPTDEEIEAFTDEELDAFLAEGEADLDSENDEDEDESDDEDEDEDYSDDDDEYDTDEEDPTHAPRKRETVSMSNKTKRKTSEVDLANARADAAESKADRALRRQAERDFAEFRKAQIGKGVPPEKIDLCEEILTRPDGMVVDLSNEGGSDDLDIADVVRELLEGYEGTIDMSEEHGHGGQYDGEGKDPDQDTLDALDAGR